MAFEKITYAPYDTLTSNQVNKIQDAIVDFDKYNQHWWSVFHDQTSEWYEEKLTEITSRVTLSDDIQYADEIVINQEDGTISLVSPQTVTLNTGSSDKTLAKENLTKLIGKYFVEDSTLYFLPETATVGTSGTSHPIYYSYNSSEGRMGYNLAVSTSDSNARIVTTEFYSIPAGDTTYVYSSDRNTYPDYGELDGFFYTYLGVPFTDFITAPKIALGSYVGTGTHKEAGAISITFNFVPKMLWVGKSAADMIMIGAFRLPSEYAVYGFEGDGAENTGNYAKINGTTVYWYNSSDPEYMQNDTGVTYNYVAIG